MVSFFTKVKITTLPFFYRPIAVSAHTAGVIAILEDSWEACLWAKCIQQLLWPCFLQCQPETGLQTCSIARAPKVYNAEKNMSAIFQKENELRRVLKILLFRWPPTWCWFCGRMDGSAMVAFWFKVVERYCLGRWLTLWSGCRQVGQIIANNHIWCVALPPSTLRD